MAFRNYDELYKYLTDITPKQDYVTDPNAVIPAEQPIVVPPPKPKQQPQLSPTQVPKAQEPVSQPIIMDEPVQEDTELKNALEQQRKTNLNAGIIEGLTQMLGGLAVSNSGVAAPVAKPDLSFLRDIAAQDVKNVELKRAEKLKDPNSAESKNSRELMKKQGLEVPDNMSAEQLQRMFPQLVQLQSAREASKSRAEESKMRRMEFDERMSMLKKDQQNTLENRRRLASQFEEQQANKYQNDLVKLDEYKEANKIENAIQNLRPLLQDAKTMGGPSLAMLGPKVAKGIAGEVGVLTEQDVTRYIQNPSIAGKTRQSLVKLSTGKLDQATAQDLERLMNIMEAKAKDQKNNAYNTAATRFSRGANIEFDKARALLDPNYPMPEGEGQPQTPAQQPNMPSAKPSTVRIRQKSTGNIKTLSFDAAQKYLTNPNYEEIK